MKIAQFIPFLTRGGAEKVVVNLSNQLISKGHDVTIYLCYPQSDNLLLNELHEKIKISYIYENKSGGSLLLYVKLFAWIRLNAKKLFEYDIIHCHLSFSSILGSILWLTTRIKIKRTKFPAVVETNHSVGTNIKSWQKILFFITSKMRDGYILMAHDKREKKKNRHSSPLIAFIPNGIEIRVQSCSKTESILKYSKQNNEFKICTIGRMVNERDPFSLVDVFHKLIQNLSPSERELIKIVWGGDGDAKNDIIKKLVEFKIIECFTFLGEVHNALEVMSSSDLYVTMNVGNITGVSGLEAASVGVPVVGVQMLSDYIATDDDWIWSSTNVDDIALKIIGYIRNSTERRQLAEKQKSFVLKNLTSEKMANRYINFYEEILRKHRS